VSGRPGALRVGWTGADRLGLTALAVAWAALLAWTWHARPSPPAADPAAVESVRERIDPNTASAASLRRLRGIGPALAGAIVDHRRARAARGRGPAFRTVDDLDDVPGIGPKTLAPIRRFLAVNAAPTPAGASGPGDR